MKRAFLFIGFILSILAVITVQISFIENIPKIAALLHLPLFISSVLLYYRKTTAAYISIFISAVLYDAYSLAPFGLFTIASAAAIAIQLFLQQRVIKQQALHAIALHVTITTCMYNLFVFIATAAFDRASVLYIDVPTVGEAIGNTLLMSGAHLMLIAIGAAIYIILAKRLALQVKSYGF